MIKSIKKEIQSLYRRLYTGPVMLLQKTIRQGRQKTLPIQRRNDPEQKLIAFIQNGENDFCEFKSTLRWNLNANRPGREIELASLKTVVAFLNTNGGTLLVGVQDDGQILGIKQDRFVNEDKFLRHFETLLKQHIGLDVVDSVSFALRTVQEKTILVVDCQKSKKPAFLKYNDREDFYIRAGSESQKLSTSQTLKYVKEHGLDLF